MKLADYNETIKRCSQCGFCQAYCPSFIANGTENFMARHRINLIRDVMVEKTMPDTQRFREILDGCLMCTSCTRECSSMIPVDEIIISARNGLIKDEKGFASLKRGFMSRLLKGKGFRDMAGVAGSVAGKLGLAPENMPKISRNPFDSRFSGTIPQQGSKKGRVAYFAGCGSNFIYPETGAAVVKVLSASGIETVVPEKLSCCGLPLISEGDIEGAAEMMRENIESLSSIDVDRVVMDCSSCRMMFIKKAPKLFDKDDPLQEKIKSLVEKISEPSAYINELGGDWPGQQAGVSFTLHVPCHSDRTAEKGILSMLGNASCEYREMENPGSCCGAGGTFYMNNPEVSEKLRASKIDEINRTGADVVLTECPMCRFYLSLGLPEKKVMHPFDLMAGRL